MSKGSTRRPQEIPDDVAAENWRRIFKPDPPPAPDPAGQPEECE